MSGGPRLSAGGLALDLAPDAGGGLAGLAWKGQPVLRAALPGAVAARDPLGLSSFPMVPYAGRIIDGALDWAGTRARLPLNWQGGAHPLHGLGWQRPWRVAEQSGTHAVLILEHSGGPDWPWAFVARQRFALDGHSARMSLEVENCDTRIFPASLGPHPYFPRAGARLAMAAGEIWETEGEALPARRARPDWLSDMAGGIAVESLDLDHGFEGWDGTARLSWPGLACRIKALVRRPGAGPSACDRVQLYVPPGSDVFCLEPVSARSAAFAAPDAEAHGVCALRPGETLGLDWEIAPEAA